MGNGMNKILPGLYVGNYRDSRDVVQLTKNGITHILSIHDNAKPLHADKKYLCILASDNAEQDLTQYFTQSIQFIHSARISGGAVLVHCLAGVSRSVTVTVAYVMTVSGLGWRDALSVTRLSRTCASPNFGFQRQLHTFQYERVLEERELLKTSFPPAPFDDEAECRHLLELSRQNDGHPGASRSPEGADGAPGVNGAPGANGARGADGAPGAIVAFGGGCGVVSSTTESCVATSEGCIVNNETVTRTDGGVGLTSAAATVELAAAVTSTTAAVEADAVTGEAATNGNQPEAWKFTESTGMPGKGAENDDNASANASVESVDRFEAKSAFDCAAMWSVVQDSPPSPDLAASQSGAIVLDQSGAEESGQSLEDDAAVVDAMFASSRSGKLSHDVTDAPPSNGSSGDASKSSYGAMDGPSFDRSRIEDEHCLAVNHSRGE